MDAGMYLSRLKEMYDSINKGLNHLAELKAGAMCNGSLDCSRDRVQTTPEDKMSKYVISYVDYERHICRSIGLYEEMRDRIADQIRRMKGPADYRKILMKIYVGFKSISQTAGEMKMSKSHVWILQRKALKEFEKQYLVYK